MTEAELRDACRDMTLQDNTGRTHEARRRLEDRRKGETDDGKPDALLNDLLRAVGLYERFEPSRADWVDFIVVETMALAQGRTSRLDAAGRVQRPLGPKKQPSERLSSSRRWVS